MAVVLSVGVESHVSKNLYIILWRWVIGIKCNKIEKLYTSKPSQGYLHPDYSVDKEKHGDQ